MLKHVLRLVGVRRRYATRCKLIDHERMTGIDKVFPGQSGVAIRRSKITEAGYVLFLQAWESTDSANTASVSTRNLWQSSGGLAPDSRLLLTHWFVTQDPYAVKIFTDRNSTHTGEIC